MSIGTDTNRDAATGRSGRVAFLNARGERLVGVLQGDLGPSVAILCHGMMSNKDGHKHIFLAQELAQRGIANLRFDFAGRGESEGEIFDMTYSRQVEDLEAAVNHLATLGVQRFGLFGSSMGGAVALLEAARDERIVAIATLAAVGHPAAMGERYPEHVRSWNERGFIEFEGARIGRGFYDDALQHDVLSAVRVLRAHLLIVHGDRDEVVNVADAHDIAIAARHATLDIVAEADHRFSSLPAMRSAMRQVADFLAQHLNEGARGAGAPQGFAAS